MGARQRIRQRQSARMYYRDYDHRDIIIGDNYHGAIYVPDRQEPAWRKYKPLLYLTETNDSYGVSIDTTNQFVSMLYEKSSEGYSDPSYDFGSATNCINGYCILANGMSKNGYDIKPWAEHSGGTDTQPYGSNSTTSVNGLAIEWTTYNYRDGQETCTSSTTSWTNLSLETATEMPLRLLYAGHHTNGCFLHEREYFNQGTANTIKREWLYLNVNKSSSASLIFFDEQTYDYFGQYTISLGADEIWKCGTHYIYAKVYQRQTSYRRFVYAMNFMVSSDSDPTTWTEVQVLPEQGSMPNVTVLWRNSTVYIYAIYGNKVHLYTSSDFSTFTEVTLPAYVDIPFVIDDIDSGRHGAVIEPEDGYETLRIVTDSTASIDYDDETIYPVMFNPNYTMLREDFNHHDYEIVNGVPQIISGEHLWLWFGEYFAYIDNMTFQTSNSNFAVWFSDYWDGTDPIDSHDYVFGNGGGS